MPNHPEEKPEGQEIEVAEVSGEEKVTVGDVIAEEFKKRAQDFTVELAELSKKHGIRLKAALMYSPGGIEPVIQYQDTNGDPEPAAQ